MPTTKIKPSFIASGSFTGSLLGTASYAITSSYAMNGGSGGTSLTTGSTYPITSSWSNNALTASYAINAVSIITASLQTGSIANQTILYNVTTSQDNVISGLNLTGNKWGIGVIEEWNSGSIVGDEYYSSCSLLLHFSGSNDSTVFIDNSPSPKTVTAIGNAKISTAQSKFGSSSAYFDGNLDGVTTPSNADFLFGTGNFTVEGWIYLTAATGDYRSIFSFSNVGVRFGNSGAYNSLLQFFLDGSTVATIWCVNKNQTQLLNSWNHIAFTREGTTCRAFVNGIQENVQNGANATSFPYASFSDSTNVINSSAPTIGYGGINSPITDFVGYIDEVRVTKGVARYTSSFSVPTSEFPATITQLQTKYIGLVGGLNDSNVDYGVEKLSDSSLKIRKMTASGQPLSGSGQLSASVDRVYVNVLDYDNVSISGSISNAISSSYSNIANTATSATSANTATSSSYATTASTATSATSANTANSATSASYSLSSSFAITAGTATSATSATSANSANTATSASYSLSSSFATNAVTATTAGTATSATSATSASYALSSSYSINSTTATSSSFASTASYNLNSVSSSYALTASYALNGGSGGTTLTTGSSYPITASWATNATTASYALNSAGGGGSISYITGSPVIAQYIVVSGSGTTQYTLTQSVSNPEHLLVSVNGVVQNYSSSYTVTGSTINFYQPYSDGDEIDVRFLNGGTTVQTGSIAGQTILYNFSSSQESTLTGLNLTGNKWGVNVIEEWNSASGEIYYPSCSLSLHCNGANGSTTFTDNSPSPKTVTATNGAAISTAQSKFGGASGLFDGTNDYISIPNNAEFNFASGTFTVELWSYFSSVSGQRVLVTNYQDSTNGWVVQLLNNVINVNLSGNGQDIIGTTTISANTWYHIALSGTPGSYKLFLNGVQESSTYTGGTTLTSTSDLTIGQIISSGYFAGYIDELRITKNVARYTASFATQSVQFPDSLPQYETKYVGLVGGLNDTNVDYGVEKLSDTSLKIRKMSVSGTPVSGSPFLSSSVDRVYVNVLNYDNVSISGSISNAVTASYAVTASHALTNITECVHLASTVSYTLPNANIVIVPFNTALIVQNITINATSSTVSGIEAYHWRHSTTGIFRLVYQVRANADSWNMISVCKNNNTALPVGNGYRSGVPNGGAWGILFECLYRVTDKSDRFGLFHWSGDTTGTQLAHAGANPPNTFFVTPDVGTAPTTGYYNSITITKV